MDIPVQILIVEEYEADTTKLLNEIKSGGYSPIYEQVNTPEDMISALKRKVWDIVIFDINMQQFIEQPALMILKNSHYDIPSIIVSERIREERIAKAIRDGASEYIFKENLLKLVPAMKIALHDYAIAKVRKQADKEVRLQQEWFKVTLSSIGDGVVTTDVYSNITFMNPVAERITGYLEEEAIGKPISYIFNIFNEITLNPAEIPVKRVLEEGFIIGLANHTGLITKDGRTLSIADSAAPIRNIDGAIIGVVMVFRDITEAKQIEEHLARLDKLNVVGQMAAGIAHEIRNPMTIVRGYLQLLHLNKDCESYKEHLALMIEEVDRANAIITGFLSLAKDRVEKIKFENINDIVQKVAPLLQAEAVMNDKYVQLQLGDIPDRQLYIGDIRQLILNFARNGLDASPSDDGIIIKTYAIDDKVFLAVQDHGPGIDKEVLKNLGSPFITTKKNGTGLGLSICYSIAEKHGTSIEVETNSEGTTFSIGF